MNPSLPSKPSLSPFVAVAFAVISVTGVLLFFHVKNGPIMVLHEWFGWAFVVAGLIHLILNWRPLLGYLRLKCGCVSLGVALLLTVGLAVAGLNHGHQGPGGRPAFAERGDH